jgi:tetrapyrrole methylase family protein/MazG family protein
VARRESQPPQFYQLAAIYARLRAPGGCPWDRVQTHATLKPYLIEETYEVVEAIEEGDAAKLCEELGDLLGQILFHAQMAAEKGKFTIEDAIGVHAEKMKRRHPHIFGNAKVKDAREVLLNWEEIKYREKRGVRNSALDGIPKHLPALIKAHRIQDKASRLGFDWEHLDAAYDTFTAELEAFAAGYAARDKRRIQAGLGDILFSLVNLARFLGIDPEDSLRRTIARFDRRFRLIERRLKRQGRSFKDVGLEEMERLWSQAK